jgi:hypothetical protein
LKEVAKVANRSAVRAVALLTLLLAGPGPLSAAPAACQVTSPAKKNTLVELFTSDGCDSCPPANKWLSGVVRGTDKTVIPVSMHVTYWNHLGWKDGYGNSYFDDRQGAYARQATSKFSYTPELFLNAREYRGWRNASAAEIANSQKELAPISIKLVSQQADARSLSVDATLTQVEGAAKADLSAIRLYVLLYEDDLAEKPNAGELKNVVLKHDHVVLDWKVIDVSEAVRSGKTVTSAFSLPPQSNPKKMGVVAFVQTADLKSIHQVVDLPFCF